MNDIQLDVIIEQMAAGYWEVLAFTDQGPDAPTDVQEAWHGPCITVHARKACRMFLAESGLVAQELLVRVVDEGVSDWARVGQLIWYSRNRHGVGFLDWAYEKDERLRALSKPLDAACKRLGDVWVYAGHNGELEVT